MDQIVDQSDLLLQRLLAAMGKADASAAERQQLEVTLPLLKTLYRRRIQHITTTEQGCEVFDTKRELLQKLLVKQAEIRELREQLGPRKRDIAWGAYRCMTQGAISEADFFSMTSPADAERMGELEAVSIQYLLDTEAAEAKKSPLRRLLIELFLCILHRHDVVPSSRKLPLNRMTEALFDWVGLDRTRRPTDTGIRTIAADMRRQLKDVPRSWR